MCVNVRLVLAFFSIYVVWGSTYLAIRLAVETIPPLATAGVRSLTAGLILYVLARGWQARVTWTQWRASLVVGTHTHAPTADDRILPAGTAFVSDVGMTADYDSIIGMNKDEPLNRFLRKLPGAKFEPSNGPATLCGLAVETDDASGLARKVGAVRLGGILQEARPSFWN